jgi:hypothetical protein
MHKIAPKIASSRKKLESAFPAKPLDANIPIDNGSISWNDSNVKVLLIISNDIKKEGHKRDAAMFTTLNLLFDCDLLPAYAEKALFLHKLC